MAWLVLMALGWGNRQVGQLSASGLLWAGLMVWVTGWMAAVAVGHLRLNLGFAALALIAWVTLGRVGNSRWVTLSLALAVFAYVVRSMVPYAFDQTTLFPHAAIESLALGATAGIAVGEAFGAAAVGAATASLASVLNGLTRHQNPDWGRHELAAVMLVALSAWLVGGLVEAWSRRPGKPA